MDKCNFISAVVSHWTFVFPLILVVLSSIMVIWRLVSMRQYRSMENRRVKRLWFLSSIMFLVWSLGFGVYMFAQTQALFSAEPSDLDYIFKSAISAMGLFAFSYDTTTFGAVEHLPFLKGVISLLTFIAGTLTILMILQLLGTRLWESLKTWWSSRIASDEELCIFFGINEATKLLAASINKASKERKFRLLFVEFPIVGEEENNSGWGGFVKMFTHRLDTFRVAKSLHARLSIAYTTPNSIQLSSDAASDRVFERMGLNDVARMIRKTSNRIHLFFLSDDEAYNIQSVAVLKRDATILEKSDSHPCRFYCHARNNSIHRVVENEIPKSGMEVKIVDSSRLCIDLLKYEKAFHPVNYVDVQNDGTVSSPFHALVIGFGEVGLDAVRFLYEFGAFVKTGSSADHVERSDFHCDVVDKNMRNLAGQFVANAPAIRPSMSFKEDAKDDAALITLHDMDCQSVDFYQKLEDSIQQLNYVVIATDDDELNISLAVRIFRLAIRHATNIEHFRILVRVKRDENLHFQQTVQYYNRLWAAEVKKDGGDSLKRQKTILSTDAIDSPITLFGLVEDIYKYDLIVSDELLERAKTFKERYDSSIKELQKQSGDDVYPTMSWDEESKTYLQLDSDYERYSPTFSNVMKLRRVQTQNYEDCFHAHTKRYLAMSALAADDYDALNSHQLFRRNNETKYQWKSGVKPNEKVTKVLDTLAQTEHLRWNASHEILGYQNHGDETFKDEARLYHGCIKLWDELSDYVKSFDYNVVDVSLDLIEMEKG